jgi:uncharacterized protein (TIRG00374 family)
MMDHILLPPSDGMNSTSSTAEVSEIGQVPDAAWKVWLRWTLALAVLGGLIWLAVRTMDFKEVAQALRTSDWRLLVAAGGVAVTVCMLACSLRLYLLTIPLPNDRRHIGFWHFTSIYYASCAAHHLLPAPAAEVLRTVHLKRRHGYSIGSLVASQLVEKVIDALGLAIEISIVAALTKLPASVSGPLALFAALTAAGVITVLVVARRFRARGASAAVAQDAGGKLRGFLYRLAEGMYLLRSPRTWLWALLCSMVNDIANAATVGLALAAVGVSLPITTWFIVVLVARLAGVLPSTPGQFGVIEAGIVVALSALGVDRNQALAAAVLYHLAHFVPVTVVGLWELRKQWAPARSAS